jgi:hypothetical protein
MFGIYLSFLHRFIYANKFDDYLFYFPFVNPFFLSTVNFPNFKLAEPFFLLVEGLSVVQMLGMGLSDF